MDDLISRQAAIDVAIAAVDEWDGGCSPAREAMIGTAIRKLPSAQTERKKGKWVFDYDNPYRRCKAKCSVCGKYSGIGGIRSNQLKPFCPNCGTPMEVE